MIVRQSGVSRPKLEDISVEEWSLGNVRIMHTLFEKSQLCGSAVKDYMAYTAKASELFRAFERTSILQFDREYRAMQAQHGFRWGTDIPHLHTSTPQTHGDGSCK